MTPAPTVPPSFIRDGFLPPSQIKRFKRLMVGSDGLSDTGKTEFALSAPGPIIVLAIDRGYEGLLQNSRPPSTRQAFGIKVIHVPLATAEVQAVYLEMWRNFYAEYRKALSNPDARTVIIDGDSDSWELQRLAEFGKLTQIPSIMYTNVNSARRVMLSRAFDSQKTIIATNKVSKEYEQIMEKNSRGEMVEKSVPTGELRRQGFADQSYLWQVQLRHMYKGPYKHPRTGKDIPGQFGVKIMKCKPDVTLIGLELWGSDCNFQSLIQTIYPDADLREWGYN